MFTRLRANPKRSSDADSLRGLQVAWAAPIGPDGGNGAGGRENKVPGAIRKAREPEEAGEIFLPEISPEDAGAGIPNKLCFF